MHSITLIFLAALVGSTTALKVQGDGVASITREVIDNVHKNEGQRKRLYEEEMDEIQDETEDLDGGLPLVGEYDFYDGEGEISYRPEVGIIPTKQQMEQAQKLRESGKDFIEVPEMDPIIEEGKPTALDTVASAASQVVGLATGQQAGVGFKQTAEAVGNAYVEQVK